MDNTITKDIEDIEPSRASIAVLVTQLIILFIVTDLIYVIANYFLMKIYFFQVPQLFDLHKYIVFILAGLHIGKSFFQIFSIIQIVMRWLGSSYIVSDKHLVKRDGIFNIVEKTYDLDNIRSVTVHQGMLGKLFHFGDVVIETSASGGYMDQITLVGLDDPQKFEHKIRHYF